MMGETVNTAPFDANALRRQMQAAAIRSVVEDRFVIVNWGTGVGKSRVGIGAVEEVFKLGGLRILLLVDQTFHKSNWQKEFEDAKGEEHGRRLFESITVECYASLPKYVGTQWDLIVADEAHHLRGENRIALLEQVKTERMLCLSATVSCKGDGEDLLAMLNSTFGFFRSFDFGVQDAIDTGILAEPVVHIHVLPIEDVSGRMDVVEEWGKKERRVKISATYADYKQYLDKQKYPAATMTIDCTMEEAYRYYSRQTELAAMKYKKLSDDRDADPKTVMWAKNRYVRCGGQRKLIIGKAKTVFARGLVGYLDKKGLKYLCFCADVDQAIELGGGHVIFSGRKDRLEDLCKRDGTEEPQFKTNEEVVAAFNEGSIRSLFAVNMIQEGQNLKGIEAGVTVQLAGKDRQFIQKFGRTLRSSKPEQHVIVAAGTKDVKYLRESLSGLDPRYFVLHGLGRLKGKIKTLDDIPVEEPVILNNEKKPDPSQPPISGLFGYNNR